MFATGHTGNIFCAADIKACQEIMRRELKVEDKWNKTYLEDVERERKEREKVYGKAPSLPPKIHSDPEGFCYGWGLKGFPSKRERLVQMARGQWEGDDPSCGKPYRSTFQDQGRSKYGIPNYTNKWYDKNGDGVFHRRTKGQDFNVYRTTPRALQKDLKDDDTESNVSYVSSVHTISLSEAERLYKPKSRLPRKNFSFCPLTQKPPKSETDSVISNASSSHSRITESSHARREKLKKLKEKATNMGSVEMGTDGRYRIKFKKKYQKEALQLKKKLVSKSPRSKVSSK